MNLDIFQETNPVSGSNILVGALYLDGVFQSSQQYTGPYEGQTQEMVFPSLQNVVYEYRCYESPDGGPDGTIRNDFFVQPSASGYQTRDDLYLIAGVSTNMIANGINNAYGPDTSLPGWNWSLEHVTQGTQQYAVQY